ncbi:MAG: carbamoyltransferase [Candidatus Micrarchaeia archaeon]
MTTYLGLSNLEPFIWYSHDTSAAIVNEDGVQSAVAEERFNRVKHYAGFPAGSLDFFSKTYGLEMKDFEAITLPWSSQPEVPSKLTNNENPSVSIEVLKKRGKAPKNVFMISHQTAHAASAFRTSGWKDALIVCLDGGGLDEGGPSSGALFLAENFELKRQVLYGPDASFGSFYGAITEALGWAYSDGEGKTMGLAPYGDPLKVRDKLSKFIPTVKGIELEKNEAFYCSFNVCNGRFCVDFSKDPSFQALRYLISQFGRENVAAAAQVLLEEAVVRLVSNAVERFGIKKVCLSGGVFLNIKVNKKLREALPSCEFFIHPNPGDGGSAIGAALEALFIETGKSPKEKMSNAYLGPEYSNEQIKAELMMFSDKLTFQSVTDASSEVADLVCDNKVVGWFQGRSEWGPRALGNRSVLALPNSKQIKDRINNLLKQRERFMPFAPSILAERASEYLQNPVASPFMVQGFDAVPEKAGDLGGVNHIDGTVRPQTVEKEENSRFHSLISCVESSTGIPAVLNTSFNRHGLPIVERPSDAVQHLVWGCVDALAIGDFIATRKK